MRLRFSNYLCIFDSFLHQQPIPSRPSEEMGESDFPYIRTAPSEKTRISAHCLVSSCCSHVQQPNRIISQRRAGTMITRISYVPTIASSFDLSYYH